MKNIPVRNFIQSAPPAIRPDTPIKEACSYLLENQVPCVPVLDDGRFIGWFTWADAIQALLGCEEKPTEGRIVAHLG